MLLPYTNFQTPSAGRWVLQHFEVKGGLPSVALCFKPHQRGGGCCSGDVYIRASIAKLLFQTPSAGRWVLQRKIVVMKSGVMVVSNPISGEVGAAALSVPLWLVSVLSTFQTPSAGRWVLQLR